MYDLVVLISESIYNYIKTLAHCSVAIKKGKKIQNIFKFEQNRKLLYYILKTYDIVTL